MTATITVRVSGELSKYVAEQIGSSDVYENTSECIKIFAYSMTASCFEIKRKDKKWGA